MFAARVWLVLVIAALVAAAGCPPGSYYWVAAGFERCALCLPGCACPGGYTACLGCSGGTFTAAANASACEVCPPGTTSDFIFNAGCDPESFTTPCANLNGPMGVTRCRAEPPDPDVAYAAPSGSLSLPPQYITNTAPYVPNVVPPYYDIDGRPMIQQSY
jgi:hypothetical protein